MIVTRYIPTRVGNSSSANRTGTPSPVHPHTSGDVPPGRNMDRAFRTYSPLVWGCTVELSVECCLLVLFPTRVEMYRRGVALLIPLQSIPHSCGDVPILALPLLQPDQVRDSLHAYQLSKRGNSLRVMAEAVCWGKRGAQINTIRPGIIITPLAKDELSSPRGDGYRRMIEQSAVGRAGTPDEVGTIGALLMGPDGAFITGSDFLMDGGVTAAYWYGDWGTK